MDNIYEQQGIPQQGIPQQEIPQPEIPQPIKTQIENLNALSEDQADIPSATSLLNSEEQQLMDEIKTGQYKKLPEELGEEFYHVVLDSDFGEFIDDTKRQNRAAVVFGRVAKKMGDRIPVLFNRDEAMHVAKKLINMVVNSGSSGNEKDKRYPYLGAVIVGLKLNKIISSKKVDIIENTNKKNTYDNINLNLNENPDLIYYDIKGNFRGLINKSVLSSTTVVNGQYIVRKDISCDNGFALLNLCSNLTVDNIKALKCLYMGEKAPCYGEGSSFRESGKLFQHIDVEPKRPVEFNKLNGGKYVDYKELAKMEKVKYLLNKEKQQGGNLDEELYKQKYIDTKREYLRLKQQKQQGGNLGEIFRQKYMNAKQEYLNLKQHSQQNNLKELFRQKYTNAKQEYLSLKQQQNKLQYQRGGNLDATDLNVASDNEEYWKPRYERKKREYVVKRNSKN